MKNSKIYADVIEAFNQSYPCLPGESLARAHLENRISELSEILCKEPLILFVLNENKRHDPESYNHMLRVGVEYCCMLEIYLNSLHQDTSRVVGFLHDAGKMYVPQKILQKPTKLTQEELKIIKCHNMLSMTVLKELEPKYCGIAGIALAHHDYPRTGAERRSKGRREFIFNIHFDRREDERRNGERRKKDALAESAGKILMICDIFDALSSPRPYKTSWSSGQVMEELGKKFPEYRDVARIVCRIFSN